MDGILVENVQVGANVLPVLFTARCLQNIPKLPIGPQAVHNVDVMLDSEENEGTRHVPLCHDVRAFIEPGRAAV